MAAVHYRQLVAPAQVDTFGQDFQTGGEQAANALAQTFRDFSGAASDAATQIQVDRGAKAGAEAGAIGSPDFKTGFWQYTAYAKAYNNAATRSYAIRSEADAEDTAARLQVQANDDPEVFRQTFTAARDATVAAAPAPARPILLDIYNRRLAAGVAQLSAARAEGFRKQARVDLSEGISRQVDQVAALRASDSPQAQQQADVEETKLGMMIDGAHRDGTITDAEAPALHLDAQRQVTAQTIVKRFQQVLDNPYGDPVGFIERLEHANGTGGPPQGTSEDSGLSAQEIIARNSAYAKPAPPSGYLTKLSPRDEVRFEAWAKQHKVPVDNSPTADYDMRGFWQALQNGDPKARSAVDPNDGKLHYPDYWKTPYDATFSNQSKWATANAPRWNDKDQLVAADGSVVWDDRKPHGGLSASSVPAEQVLPPAEHQHLVRQLFSTLAEHNTLLAAQTRQARLDSEARYEQGDRDATASLLSGTLTQRQLLNMVTQQRLKPETARTLLDQLDKGDAKKDDPETYFDIKTNLLNYSEADIATANDLTFKTRAALIDERRKEATGWKSTQAAKEAQQRIDRALGIVPGTIIQMLPDSVKTQRNRALTQWYDEVDALPPEERQSKVISTAEDVIKKVVRQASLDVVAEKQQDKADYQRRMVAEFGPMSSWSKSQKQEYDQNIARYDADITRLQQEAARK